jgi:hypothetical protein
MMVCRALTTSLKIRETALSACLSADVQEDRSSRLVVRRVEEVTLLERVLCMWLIATRVLEVVDLPAVSQDLSRILFRHIPAGQ